MFDFVSFFPRAVAKGIEGLKPGVTTELELYKSIARQGYLCGSEHFTFMSLVSGPERALCADCPPSDEVISAEPGIYLPGKFGVRIEDVLYLSGEGCVDITKAPKDLLIL